MFDRKKLESFLDSLETQTHFPLDVPPKIVLPERTALESKMDKYDIFKQGGYENVSTAEFPVLAKPQRGFQFGFSGLMQMPSSPFYAPVYPTYGGISRSAGFPVPGFNDAPSA